MSDTLMCGEYPFDQVSSVLHKEIRRGDEEKAMYWALMFSKHGFTAFLWRRLLSIAAEDIGISNGDSSVIPFIYACYEANLVIQKGKTDQLDSNMLACVILKMCRAVKSRESSDLDWMIQEDIKAGVRLEMPDYAIDQHTEEGRKKGYVGDMGDLFFCTEGAKLDKEAKSKYKIRVLKKMGYPEEVIEEITKNDKIVD